VSGRGPRLSHYRGLSGKGPCEDQQQAEGSRIGEQAFSSKVYSWFIILKKYCESVGEAESLLEFKFDKGIYLEGVKPFEQRPH
jgi:hypothetical protein